MYRAGLLATIVLALVCMSGQSEASWLSSPRYKLYDRATLVQVEGPNVLRLYMSRHGRTMTVRLLGVGSPHNRVRFKFFTPSQISYIEQEDVWNKAKTYIESLLTDRRLEVWARKGNQYDEKNRLLAYILIPSESGESLDVNAELIKRGLCFVTRDYVHVTFTGYKILEEEARECRRGLWKGITPGRVSSLTE